ncbi:MAG: hypothetical protein ACRCY8_06910 [Dermatophilaceae bacterium]
MTSRSPARRPDDAALAVSGRMPRSRWGPDDAALAVSDRMTRSRSGPDDAAPAVPSPIPRWGPDDAALAARLRRAVARHPPGIGPAAGHRCAGATHSRTADGRIVCWSVPPVDGQRVAVDAECADAALPPALARRWSGMLPGCLPDCSSADRSPGEPPAGWSTHPSAGRPEMAGWLRSGDCSGLSPERFVLAWTATEVAAKLTDMPVLLLARQGPVTADALTAMGRRIVLHHERRAGLQLCFGLSAPH